MDILGHIGPAVGPQDLMSLPSLDGSPPQPSEARPWLQDGAVNFFSDILKSHYVPTRIEYNEDQTTHDCSQVEAVGELVSHLQLSDGYRKIDPGFQILAKKRVC